MATEAEEYRIRMALAASAHDANVIRLKQRNLLGYDHIVASRAGLFAVRPGESQLVAYGQFYGIAIDENAIYAFEACGQPRIRSNRGRIICLRHRDGRIDSEDVIASKLDNGCHQMDLIDGQLYLTDTYNQRLLIIALDGTLVDTIYPLGRLEREAPNDYAHINSLLAVGDSFCLLKHNNSLKSGLNSEIAVFNRQWQPMETIALEGQGCHNLALLEDGNLVSCGSMAGEIIGPGLSPIKICDRMTRGLSVSEDQVVVGGSAMLSRDMRDQASGEVYFLNRDFRQLGPANIPGPVMEIRRIDGRDRSLSAHLKLAGSDLKEIFRR